MTIYVELPSDPLIELNAFCRAIAKAVCPADENGPEGIDCIVGKLVTHQAPLPDSAVGASGLLATSWQNVLASQDGKTLDQHRPPDQGDSQCGLPFHTVAANPIVEVSFPYILTDADRAALEPLLPSLPQLRYPISSEQQEAFKQAYCELAEHPTWLPILISDNAMEQRKADQEHIRTQHQSALLQEVSSGRLTLLDANHAPVKGPGVGSFLPRIQAIGYLKRHGLTVGTGKQDSACDSDLANLDASPAIDTPQPIPSDQAPAVGTSRHSADDIKLAVEEWHKLKAGGDKSPTKTMAIKCGVTDRTFRTWIKKARDKKAREEARQKNATTHKLR